MSKGWRLMEAPMKTALITGWLGGASLIGAAIANKDTMWLFLALMTASVAVTAGLGAASLVITKASAYWARQPGRVRAGLDVEPEPWYVRLTARSHEIKLLRRLLG